MGQGPTALDEEEEDLARQVEADLQAILVLSHEEARRSSLNVASPEASVEPALLGLASSSAPMVDVKELSELEERIRSIDGCTSQAEYRYHVLGERVPWDPFGTSNIMDEEERQKIIAVGKRPEETGVAQVSREVMRPDASVPSEWKLLEEALAKARNLAREGLELLEMGRGAKRAEALREEAEGAVSELCSVLDATRVELDEARNDIKGVSLAKQDLKQALAEATTQASDLHLQKFNVEASFRRLSNQVGHAREEMFRLSSQLGTVRAERDEAIGSVAAAMKEALGFSTELVALRSKVEALRAHNIDPGISGEMSRTELEAVKGKLSAL
ncbi:hypothetical protein ACLOJK_037039 [Asimina triloba]